MNHEDRMEVGVKAMAILDAMEDDALVEAVEKMAAQVDKVVTEMEKRGLPPRDVRATLIGVVMHVLLPPDADES